MIGGTETVTYRVTFESRVTEDVKNGMFLYWYRMCDRGNVGVLARWGIVEHAARGVDVQLGEDFETMLIALKPGQCKEFRLASIDLPMYYQGMLGKVQVYFRASTGYVRELESKRRFYTTSTNMVVAVDSGSEMPGFLPERWVLLDSIKK